MDKFLKEYNNRKIEDWGSVVSDDFKLFARKFKGYLKRTLPEFNIIGFGTGHYYIYGFMERDGNYIYFYYEVPRYEQHPIDVYTDNYMFGVLIRTAKSDDDYRGGSNHYCSLATMPDSIRKLYNSSYAKEQEIA